MWASREGIAVGHWARTPNARGCNGPGGTRKHRQRVRKRSSVLKEPIQITDGVEARYDADGRFMLVRWWRRETARLPCHILGYGAVQICAYARRARVRPRVLFHERLVVVSQMLCQLGIKQAMNDRLSSMFNAVSIQYLPGHSRTGLPTTISFNCNAPFAHERVRPPQRWLHLHSMSQRGQSHAEVHSL